MTQFAMDQTASVVGLARRIPADVERNRREDAVRPRVEELASLVKDNLYCKHLILSTEEALTSFLQSDSSPEAVLELPPMGPYQRLLLHRLAEIYGFAHESVGEGEERHLLLERCPETAIPRILVSDILWQYGEYQSATPANLILRRKKSPEKEDKAAPSSTPLEVREAAYLAARERIFSLHEADEKESVLPKSRKVPVVAQRMIAHALGQKVSSLHVHEKDDQNDDLTICAPNNTDGTSEVSETRKAVSRQKKDAKFLAKTSSSGSLLEPELKPRSSAATHRKTANPENLEKEQIGAAKRIFAQALGIASSNRGQDVLSRTSEDGTTLSH